MLHSRTRTYLSSFVLLLSLISLLTACKQDDPEPAVDSFTTTKVAHSWQLDEVVKAGSTFSSGSSIKDRYTMSFRNDGSYTQTLLADKTEFVGSWMLMGTNNSTLHITDHKGALHEYTLTKATDQQLRYGYVNSANQLEEYVFSLLP